MRRRAPMRRLRTSAAGWRPLIAYGVTRHSDASRVTAFARGRLAVSSASESISLCAVEVLGPAARRP